MRKKVLALVMAGAMILSVTACGKGETSNGDTSAKNDTVEAEGTEEAEDTQAESESGSYKIAYVVKALNMQFWTDMKAGAEACAAENGVELTFQAPDKESDVEIQVQMVENAITSGVDALILSAADSKALNPSIVKANEAGIPVILVNDTIDDAALEADGGHYETYVGIDQYESAALAGKYCVENLEKGKVAILEGIPGIVAHEQRLEGFKDTVEEAGFEIVASQTANCDRNEAFNVAQNILTSNPDVSIMWATNAEMGQGAIQAIEQLGKTGISVFDFDASDDDMETIKAGTLVGTVDQYPSKQGEYAVNAAIAVIKGEKLDPITSVPAELITKDNVK